MDPRNTTTNNPFTRPPSQPNGHDAHRAPIPPPPYTLQAPVQRQPRLGHDPFLPRRQEQGDARQDMDKSFRHAPLGVVKYGASLPKDALGNTTEDYRAQDNGGGWRFGDGRMDRFRHQASSGSSNSTPLPPPPPPSSASFGGPLHDPSAQRDSPRQQEHRTSSPRMYGAKQEILPPPPPPPPPFINRPMLPPSPSYTMRTPMSQIPPPPNPSFSSARELPALSSTARPGSSMSILSMLDSAPARSSREPSNAAPMNGTSPTSSYPSSTQHFPPAPSPTRSNHSNGFSHRSSPDRHHISQAQAHRPFRAYSGGAPHRSHPTTKAGSPDGFKSGPLSATSLSQYSPRSETAAQQDWKQEHSRDPSVGQAIERPNSQPSSYRLQLEAVERSNMERLQQARREQLALQEENVARDASLRQATRNGVSSFDFLPREAQLERQRQLERQAQLDQQQRMEQEQRTRAHGSPRDDRLRGMDYPFLTQSSVFSEPSVSGPGPEKATFATRFNRDSHTPLNIPKGPYSDETLRRLREEHQNSSQRASNLLPAAPRSRFLDNMDERQMQPYPQNTMSGPMVRTRSVDGINQNRNADDELQGHRSMLGMLLDNRRVGRISPLPQAVQGAQGQTRGPSSDPSIKNEFSRMFAGIGSGVGSAGMNSGTSTPFKPPSPTPTADNDHRTPFGSRIELIALHKSQDRSRAGKRRKNKDDDLKTLEVMEDRSTGASGTRAGKRKHGHIDRHDYLRLHHHRLNENGIPSRLTSHSTNPADHRHHYHPHHEIDSAGNVIHHHNHSKAKPAPPIPTIVINNEAIASSISTVPRRHLGSVLYAPTLEPPDSEHSHTISHYVIPRCDGKANCTLTVRIPRFYLSKEEREKVCRTRYVYGTDIYADDSDPLGAAIHAGWVCGDWGDDSVLEALGVDLTKKEHKTQEMACVNPPVSPILPPEGKDLHVTLLILPQLQRYIEKRSHGIKSREWGSDHDGMSYRIEKIQWVDEGAGRGEERTAAARRKRLRTALGPDYIGPALRLGLGRSLGKPLESAKIGAVAA